jgi:prepilin-type N-terminal cleavage/methylation domain-containing protein
LVLLREYRGRRRGFTLLELLLTLVLFGVLLAFAWPEVSGVAAAEKLRESATRLRGLIARCRAEAMRETLRYRIRVLPDGSLAFERQRDAITAPHEYIAPPDSWARTQILQEGVWVEAVQILPEGPPPIMIIDEQLQFPEMDFRPVAVSELETPAELYFNPSGMSNSARFLLRDMRGRALLVTVDGRLGRVTTEDYTAQSAEEVHRPAPK